MKLKKILSILLIAIACVIVLCACGEEKNKANSTESSKITNSSSLDDKENISSATQKEDQDTGDSSTTVSGSNSDNSSTTVSSSNGEGDTEKEENKDDLWTGNKQ